MTLSSFFDELVQQYKQAESITQVYHREHIYRGRQHSISSIAEDLFAALLYDTLKPMFPNLNLYFMVDYPITPSGQPSRMFPDIAIIAEDKVPVLVSYLDLKTDLGYKRNYFESFEEIQKKVKLLKSAQYTGTYTHPGKVAVQISPQVKWRTVVISDTNISSKEVLELNKQKAALVSENFKLYFLSGKSHPNEKRREKIDTYQDAPFLELIGDLKQEIELALPNISVQVV